jgi:predicted aldo/keto reductase-like oxidoreductase
MKDKSNGCSRRDFFKAASVAGMGALLSPLAANARIAEKGKDDLLAAGQASVPTRPFGKTGVQVSTLALGGMFDISANQLMLRQALNWGVTYWDTADCYHSGSEAGIGKYFAKYPRDREKVFLVSKSDARDPEGISQLLERSLQRLNTAYIDLYFIHGVRNIDELSDATRRWAEKAKADGKIRFFGFSTHGNMEALLTRAAKLGYIDGIMLTYNFRNMHTPEMKAAVEVCVKAGIGLTAMKTQAERSWFNSSPAEKGGAELMEAFIKKGMSEQQAKLKAVWTNPDIASICSQMPSMAILKANVAAAADTAPLTSQEMRLFKQYALETADQYCAGCGHICETALAGRVPVGDIMRYHMYGQSYGRLDWAREQFGKLGPEVRLRMAQIDYGAAERHCPQRMPIARLMQQALEEFS